MDIYTIRNNAFRNMLKGYTYCEGHTPDGATFSVTVRFHDRATGIRGTNPEKPTLSTYYVVHIAGNRVMTLEREEQVKALIVNNGWIIE